MQPHTPSPLLSVRDLTRILGVNRTTVWALGKTGAIPRPMKIGRRILWRPQDIQKFIDARAVAANEAATR